LHLGERWAANSGCSQLFIRTRAVLSPATVFGPSWQDRRAARPHESYDYLLSKRRRARRQGALPGRAALAAPCVHGRGEIADDVSSRLAPHVQTPAVLRRADLAQIIEPIRDHDTVKELNTLVTQLRFDPQP